MSGILLVGGGGHCRSVIDVLEACKQPIAGIIHGPDCSLDSILGYPSLGRDEDLENLYSKYNLALITLGQIKTATIRQKLFNLLNSTGFILPTIISPLAYVSSHSTVGQGSIVMHHALVNAKSTIGDNCIINTKALVEHDCIIANHCHVAIGAVLCGDVHVGEGSFIGANVTIMQGVRIGKNCIIGMGCTVKKNIADGEIYA